MAAPASEEKVEPVVEIKRPRPSIGEDHTIIEAISTTDFWILFASFLCGVGTGLAVMNNMGQMGLALGYVDVSIFVSLTSIWGFFGRILSGSVSEYFIGSCQKLKKTFQEWGLEQKLPLGNIVAGLLFATPLQDLTSGRYCSGVKVRGIKREKYPNSLILVGCSLFQLGERSCDAFACSPNHRIPFGFKSKGKVLWQNLSIWEGEGMNPKQIGQVLPPPDFQIDNLPTSWMLP
ncbi:hypothetical protein CK203_075543 [Vitis vinifera]|uniref:NFD4 C-terminal domain-containing protein n=1 Tax=Vitis vinifera TaxID=29760 RepID=A0A438DSS4_VITVI|nr:hypothetical protein CK203_075543 [Vitis vinifera]